MSSGRETLEGEGIFLDKNALFSWTRGCGSAPRGWDAACLLLLLLLLLFLLLLARRQKQSQAWAEHMDLTGNT